MARTFNGTTSRLTLSGAMDNDGSLFSISAFANSTSSTANQIITSISRVSAPFNQYTQIDLQGGVGGDPAALDVGGVLAGGATTTAGYSTNTWQVTSGSNSASNARAAYLNGANKGTNSTNTGAVSYGTAETYVGCWSSGGAVANFFAGDICEVAWYSVNLTDRQHAGLGKGACPLLVSTSVRSYWPLWPGYADNSTIVGLIRGTPLTPTDSGSSRHAPVFARNTGGV